MRKKETIIEIARWKLDNPIENVLSYGADKSELLKRIYVLFYKIFDYKYYKKGLLMAAKQIDCFLGVGISKKQKKYLIRDMIYSLHRFGCNFDEYFWYDFYHLNTKGRSDFITDKIRYYLYALMNKKENSIYFDDKYKCYETFKKYYKRDVIQLDSIDDIGKFTEFVKEHNDFIVKPIMDSCGRGVEIYRGCNNDYLNILKDILLRGRVVIEELIIQNKATAEFHCNSLNTVRIPTVKCKNDVKVLTPFFRMGRGTSIVDNAGSGGIFANVDIDTGILKTNGIDEYGNTFIVHPDTDKTISGFQIPRWKEAVDMAKELANVVKGQRYTGWDLALTDTGWVMVEGNSCGQFVMQIVDRKGIMKELNDMIKDI